MSWLLSPISATKITPKASSVAWSKGFPLLPGRGASGTRPRPGNRCRVAGRRSRPPAEIAGPGDRGSSPSVSITWREGYSPSPEVDATQPLIGIQLGAQEVVDALAGQLAHGRGGGLDAVRALRVDGEV